jgi:hypothetical protein
VGRLVGQRVRFSEHAAPAPTLPGAGTPRDIVRRGFLYDPEGGLVGITDDRWGRIDYMFDPVDRLLQVIRERGLTEFFTYDGCGNVVRGDRKGTGGGVEGREYGPGNRLPARVRCSTSTTLKAVESREVKRPPAERRRRGATSGTPSIAFTR